jgi:hypothetical protein
VEIDIKTQIAAVIGGGHVESRAGGAGSLGRLKILIATRGSRPAA